MANTSITTTTKRWLVEAWEIIVLLLIVFLIRTFGFGLYQVPSGSMETTMLVGERFFSDKFTPLFRPFKQGDIIACNYPSYPYSKNYLINLMQRYVGWFQRDPSTGTYAWGPINLTKRIIGVPGDTVQGVIEEGKPVVYLNGKKLDEPYLNKYPLIGVSDRSMLSASTVQPTFKSYNPTKPYDKQPFYAIQPNHVLKDYDGKPILLEPGVATPASERGAMHREGQNYWNGSDEFYVKLGTNQYWGMGDNRRNSGDSRYFGPIDGTLIHGRILFRILSIDIDGAGSMPNASWLEWLKSCLPVQIMLHPIDFWGKIRWNRMFQMVR